MNEIFVKIRFLMKTLPRAEKVIAGALLENPEAITNMTLAEISRESGTSEASIVRFCKRMGYSGYSEMKNDFIRCLAEGVEVQPEELESSDDMSTIIRKVYQSNLQTMSDTLVLATDDYEKAVNAMVKADSIHFFGVGDAYAVCLLAQMRFARLGIKCILNSDVMMQMIDANNMNENDVAIAISFEGRSQNVVEAMRIAKEAGATTICITKRNKSPLLKYTDINLFISVNDLTVGKDKATRRIADQFIMDVLYFGYIMRSGKRYKSQFQKVQKAIDKNKIQE